MQEIQVFDNEEFGQIRVGEVGGEPRFVARDLCVALGIGNPSDAVRRLDGDEVDSIEVIDSMGRAQLMSAVTEAGMYSLVLSSRKPEARAFKRWVTHEVLPSIRRRGAYLAPEVAERVVSDPDTIIRLAQEVKAERARSAALRAERDAMAPRAAAYLETESTEGLFSVGHLGKLLTQAGVRGMGPVNVFKVLAADGIIYRREGGWMPSQRMVEQGLMRVRLGTKRFEDGTDKAYSTVQLTTKGLHRLFERYAGHCRQQTMEVVA